MNSAMKFYFAVVALSTAGLIGMGISTVEAGTYTIKGKVTDIRSEYLKKTCNADDCLELDLSHEGTGNYQLGVVEPYLQHNDEEILASSETVNLCEKQKDGTWDAAIVEIFKQALFPNGEKDCPVVVTKGGYTLDTTFDITVTLDDMPKCGNYKLDAQFSDRPPEYDGWVYLGVILIDLTIPDDGNCS